MANRSYLFASNALPHPGWDAASRSRLRGISEHAYAVPLLYRLLVSVDSRAISSAIWNNEHPLAIAGQAQAGMERALQFLQQIQHPEIAGFRAEADAFLRQHIQPGNWLILESAEVLSMDDTALETQVQQLLGRMPQIDAECSQALAALQPQPASFWQRIFKPSNESLQEPLRELGLGGWSEHLYFSWEQPAAEDD